MRIIRTFKWCKKYDLKQVEMDCNLNNNKVIIYKAKKITRVKHMVEVIKWARNFPEYRIAFDKPLFTYVWEWLKFNLFNSNNIDYITFNK